MPDKKQLNQFTKISMLSHPPDIIDNKEEIKPEIDNLCSDCGTYLLSLQINKGKKQFQVSSWYPGTCDYCNQEKTITEARDFGYPNLPLKIK